MSQKVFYCLSLVLIISGTQCLNKEVYEDTDDYAFDFKDIKGIKDIKGDKKSDFDSKPTALNSTGINVQQKAVPSDYDNYKEYQRFDANTGTDANKQEMVVVPNKDNQKLMDKQNSQGMGKAVVGAGSIATTISTANAGLSLGQSVVGSPLILSTDTTTTVSQLMKAKAIKINGVPINVSLIGSTTTAVPLVFTLIPSDKLNITQNTSQLMTTTQQRAQTYPETEPTITTTVSPPQEIPQQKDFILSASAITSEEVNGTTTSSPPLTMNPELAKLLEDSDDDISLPPFPDPAKNGHSGNRGLGHPSQPWLNQGGQANSRQNSRFSYPKSPFQPIGPKSVLSPLSPMSRYPIFPIMPPQLPENDGFQTIWVPIQVRRDSHSLKEMWKKSKTPNFIERGHIKQEPAYTEGTPDSWWRKARPKYCFDPIVVEYYCADRQPLKKWSYNEADERCYRYIDYCSASKLNSFDTLQDCLMSCWRARPLT